nr:uncharacterized protein LOC127303922 [Lolium perenne]
MAAPTPAARHELLPGLARGLRCWQPAPPPPVPRAWRTMLATSSAPPRHGSPAPATSARHGSPPPGDLRPAPPLPGDLRPRPRPRPAVARPASCPPRHGSPRAGDLRPPRLAPPGDPPPRPALAPATFDPPRPAPPWRAPLVQARRGGGFLASGMVAGMRDAACHGAGAGTSTPVVDAAPSMHARARSRSVGRRGRPDGGAAPFLASSTAPSAAAAPVRCRRRRCKLAAGAARSTSPVRLQARRGRGACFASGDFRRV